MSGESPTTSCTRDKMFDVFILHEMNVDDIMAHEIGGVLEQQKKLKVLTKLNPGALPAGCSIYDSIVQRIHDSAKTVILLTEKSSESPWVLEIVQAINQSQQSGLLTLRLIVNNVQDEQLQFLRRGILATVPHFRLDFAEEDWQANLVEYITREVPLPDILPLEGSLSHGLVFSHYAGFLSYVLPLLRKEIQDIEIYKKNPGCVSRKYFLLLPKTCEVPNSLESSDADNKIHIEMESIIKFEKLHAGKLRRFSLTIYKITKKTESGDEGYYFFADCPYILNAMFVMKNQGLKEVDMNHQLAQLYHVLGDVINHAENDDCFGTVKIIVHDENEGSLQSALYKAVKESMEMETKGDMQGQNMDMSDNVEKNNEKGEMEAERECSLTNNVSAAGTTDVECRVAINYSEDSPQDCKEAVKLDEFLESREITVYMDKGNETALNIRPGRWQLFVLSKQAVSRPNTLLYRCSVVLHKAIRENALHVVLVLVDIEPKELPSYINWLPMVNAAEPNHYEKLLMTINGGIVRMEHRLPSGDVATGLAWAYVINYLKITLLGRDLSSRIRKFLKDNKVECGCVLKMFPILPKSCTVEDSLKDKANEGNEHNRFVEYLGKLDPVIANTGCQLGRHFYLHVYKLTDVAEQKSVCFIAEYFTPGYCLHEMAYRYHFAGLQTDDMTVQGRRTVDLVKDILHTSTVKCKLGDMSDLVEIIYYDDSQEALMSALYKHIPEKIADHTRVFAEEN